MNRIIKGVAYSLLYILWFVACYMTFDYWISSIIEVLK